MLDLAVYAGADLRESAKMAVSSMISTARANLSVGPPYDLGIYRDGTFVLDARFEPDSPVPAEISREWIGQLVEGMHELPDVVAPDGRTASPTEV